MTGPDGPLKMVQGLIKAVIAKVRDIQDHSQPLHFRKQLASPWAESSRCVRALGIGARPIMSEANRAQTVGKGAFEAGRVDDGVRAGAAGSEDRG